MNAVHKVTVIVGLLVNQMVLLWEFRTLRLSLVVLTLVAIPAIFNLASRVGRSPRAAALPAVASAQA